MEHSTSHWLDRFQQGCSVRLPGQRWEKWIFWALVLLALALRYPGTPYTHDELSALLRLFPTLSETIEQGVRIGDTHPPGVQVFEWFWTRAIGTGEDAVKFPFMVMGIAALFFLYRFASAWTNTTVALVVLALLATMQYSVMYSQIARPYAVGFFTCALLLDQLTRYVGSGRRRALSGFALAAVLSAYTHHFAMLFAALVSISAFALLRPGQAKAYAIACGIAVLLYLPNIPILMHQFSKGGLSDWLAPPGPYWLEDYLRWIFMYSWPLAIACLAIVLFGVVNSIRTKRWREPLPWLLIFWGLAPLIIGYVYSIWRAPMLQYSMLLFSFPCLLLAAFHGFPQLSLKWTLPAVGILAALGVHGLVVERDHYTLFQASKYEAFSNVASAQQAHGGLAIVDMQQGILDFYFARIDRYGDGPNYVLTSSIIDADDLGELLLDPELVSVDLGITPSTRPELPSMVQEFFPVLSGVENFCEGSILHFAKAGRPFRAGLSRELNLPIWSDSTVVEFPAIVEAGISQLIQGPNDVIEVRATFPYRIGSDITLAGDLFDRGKSIAFRESHVKEAGTIRSDSVTLHLAFNMADYEKRDRQLHFKAYVHNLTGRWPGTPKVEVRVRAGNPIVYGLYGPIHGQ